MVLGLHIGLDNSSLTNSALIAGAVAAFVLSVCRRPEFGLYYIVPLLPLQTLRYRLHDIALGAQLIDIIFLGVVIGLWRQGHGIFAKTPLTKLFTILVVFTYFSLWKGALYLGSPLPAWITDPRFSDWKNYIEMFFVFFLVLAAIRTPKQIKILLFLMSLSVLVLNRSYINTIRGRDFSTFSYSLRDSGPMGYCGVNGFAAFEAQIGVFLLALYCFHKKTLPRLWYLLVLGTSLYGHMFSLSRAGYLALLVGIAFIGLLKSRTLLVGLVLFFCTWQTLVPGAVQQRVFMTREADGELDASAGTRVDLWEDAMQTIRTDPVFGTGIFTYAYNAHLGGYRDTHNLYVKVALETGIVGLILLLLIFRRLFSIGFSLFRRRCIDDFTRGIGFGFAALIVSAAVGNFFGDRWIYIEITGFTTTIAAIAVRLHMLSDEEQEAEEESQESDLQNGDFCSEQLAEV